MRPFSKLLVPLFVLALATLACGITFNVDTGSKQTDPKTVSGIDQISTMVAQTLEAMTQPAPSSTPALTATSTPIPIPVTLSVSSATDCYAGPSSAYGFVITVRPGTIVRVTGKDTADNYWIVEVPGYPGSLCWLSGEHAQVTGDTAFLPAPATPLPSLYTLDEPRNLRVSCSVESVWDDDDDEWDEQWNITFRWTNTEPDQAYVRVFRNGWQVATMRGHASSYSEVLTHHHKHGITYGVQAVNGSRVSSIVTVYLKRCK